MIRIRTKSISQSKLTKHSQRSSNINIINSQLKQKLTIVKSQLGLKNSQTNGISSSNLNSGQRGKTAQFHENRKESYLNSKYNKRKNNLLQITKENRKIYERINSQKSNYSSRVLLNKSYDSVGPLSSRVSQASSRSRSRTSNNGKSLKNSSRRTLLQGSKKGCVQPLVKAQNINKINRQQVLDFNRVFCKPPKIPKLVKEPNNQNAMEKIQQYPNQNIIFQSNPHLSSNKLKAFQFTPDKNKLSQTMKKTPIGLPKVLEKTPQKSTVLQKIIEDLGYKYRY